MSNYLVLGIGLSLLSAISFSFSNIFVKKGTVKENVFSSIFITMIASEFIVLISSMASGEFFSLGNLSPAAILIYALTGFLGFTVGRTLNYSSIANVGPSLTSTVISGRIIFALILSLFLISDRVTPVDILGDLVVMTGIIIVTMDRRKTEKFPILYILLPFAAAAAVGAGDVLIRISDTMSSLPIDGTLIAYIIGIVSYIPIQGRRIFSGIRSLPRDRVNFLILAGISSGLAQVFRFTGLEFAPVFIAVPLIALTPIITVCFSSYSLRDEKIRARFVAGVIITVLGVFVLNMPL